MKPCDRTMPSIAAKRACSGLSGEKSQRAEMNRARSVWSRSVVLSRYSRMSSHLTFRPLARRYAAPSSVAASSPTLSTRACTRGLTSRISLAPAMTCASAAKRSSNILASTPRSRASASCCARIFAILSSVSPPATAVSRRAISAFETPTSAEWTTTGRTPSSSRSRMSRATMAQFSAVETLRPPNLSTTHGESGYGVSTAWLAPSTDCDDMEGLWTSRLELVVF